jgi:hypothetical protein
VCDILLCFRNGNTNNYNFQILHRGDTKVYVKAFNYLVTAGI